MSDETNMGRDLGTSSMTSKGHKDISIGTEDLVPYFVLMEYTNVLNRVTFFIKPLCGT